MLLQPRFGNVEGSAFSLQRSSCGGVKVSTWE